MRFIFDFKPIDWKNKESILRELLFVFIYLCLAILTAPLSFLIVPFLMISYIRRIVSKSFSTQDIVLYLIPILTFAIHLCICVSSHSSKPFEIPSVFLILKLFSIQVIENLFYWGDISPFLLDFLIFSLVIFVLIVLMNSILKKTLIDVFLIFILLTSLFYLVFSFLNRWGYSVLTIESLISIGRYLFIPVSFFIIWFIRQINEYKGNIILICLLFLVIFNISIHYTLTPYDNYNFKQYAKYYDPAGTYSCHIPINPNGWSMSFPCTEEATRVLMYNTTQDLKNSNRVPTFSRRL